MENLTVEQMKARAYDLLATRQQIDAQLQAINRAIAEASQKKPKEEKDVTTKDKKK